MARNQVLAGGGTEAAPPRGGIIIPDAGGSALGAYRCVTTSFTVIDPDGARTPVYRATSPAPPWGR